MYPVAEEIDKIDGRKVDRLDAKGNYSTELEAAREMFSYNWPYDYFSIVELAELEAKVDFYKGTNFGATALSEIETDPAGALVDFATSEVTMNNSDPESYWGASSFGQAAAATSNDGLDNLVIREVLKADTDSVGSSPNQLTISGATLKSGTESIYINGLLQTVGGDNDYTVSGNTITFTFDLEDEDKVQITYVKE